MTHKLITLLCCAVLMTTASAQTRKKTTRRTATRTTAKAQTPIPADAEKATVSEDAELLFNAYRFEEAAELLKKEMETAQKKRMSSELLEAKMQKTRIGENMLQATQKVVFVDSFVVAKNDFLKAIRLNPSCGTVATYAEAIGGDKASNKLRASTVYINEFQDQMLFNAEKDGALRLYTTNKVGEQWSTGTALSELSAFSTAEGYPYVLSDGTTLYYAAEGENSLGGYDIYVTRYNTDTKKYLKPENIGMPFNSPANDYLYIVDEANHLGWFVSDRYQPEGRVCVYVFIPTESREVYQINDENDERVRSLARIASIKESQANRNSVAEALARLKDVQQAKAQQTTTSDFAFVVANGVTYHSLNSFKSAKAMQMAGTLQQTWAQRKALEKELATNRRLYGQGDKKIQATILKQEQSLEQLDTAIRTMENDIRKEEQSSMEKK